MSDRDCEKCKHHTEKGCDSWDCNFERKVTRKETIKVFEDMKKGLYPFDLTDYLDIAINSLEIDEQYELEYEQIEQKTDVLDKIRAKIAEYGSIWVVYEITDKTKTDKGIEKLVSDVLSQAKEQVLDIIDKYKAESEDKE